MAKKDIKKQQESKEQEMGGSTAISEEGVQERHQEKMKKLLERQKDQKDEGQLGPDPNQPPGRLAPNIQPGQPIPSEPDPKQYPSEGPKQEFGARLKRSGLLPREPSE